MRVSLINLNLVAKDAIGQSMLHQLRFHQRRGDEVRIYVMYPPEGIAANIREMVRVVDVIDLLGHQDQFFQNSDLYVYHYPGRYALLDTIKTLDRGAVVFYYHNVTPPELWGSESGRAELAQSQAAVAHYTPFADIIVTDSTYNAEELQTVHGIAPGQIRVLALAVPLDSFKPGESDLELVRRYGLAGKEVLLYVGRVAGNKRVDLLVEALAKVKAERANVLLLVVGDHDSNPAFTEITANIRARAKQLGVSDDVIFAGRVEELPAYYRLATLYVSASLHEGFGVPLIEAMASGVPIVTTKVGSQPWVMGDAGILVTPGDVDELAAQIKAVLSDDALRGDLVQRGLQRAVDFSLEAYNNGWTRIVTEVQEWLVARPSRPLRLSRPTTGNSGNASTALLDLPLQDEVKLLHQAAESVLKPYELQSKVPVVGPLIVWLRRNLTSHLREPYLDPTLRRQERFNWLVVQTMRQVNRLLEQSNSERQPQAALDQRVTQLETQVTGVLDLLATELDQVQRADPTTRDAALAALHQKVKQLRQESPHPRPLHVAETPKSDAPGAPSAQPSQQRTT
jgi:glycosyltransferase involved in cell wall biosynthesis